MTDLQFSTARGSNEDVARPKRVTSFTVSKPKSNESGLNTERFGDPKTTRTNPGNNKRSNDSSSNNVQTGSFNSKRARKRAYDPTGGMLG